MAVAFVAALLASLQLLAQTDPCRRRSIPVNVFNDRGQIVTGLSEKNFTGSVHHQPVKVISVSPDGTARRVIIVLDASGSMLAEPGLWRLYLTVGRNLIAPMPSGTLVGLVVFSSKIEKNLPLTASKKALQDELAILEPGIKALPKGPRHTALWDALETAASGFGTPQEGDAIYAITDGGDNASKTGLNSLREDLLAKFIRLFTFSVNLSGAGPTPEERNGPADLMDLDDATGGYAVHLLSNAIGRPPGLLDGSDKLTAEGERLMLQFRQIFSFQRMEVQFPKALDKTQGWNLRVTGMKAKDFTVVYPHQLAGCSMSAQSASTSR